MESTGVDRWRKSEVCDTVLGDEVEDTDLIHLRV